MLIYRYIHYNIFIVDFPMRIPVFGDVQATFHDTSNLCQASVGGGAPFTEITNQQDSSKV